jgi:hypothetical protein
MEYIDLRKKKGILFKDDYTHFKKKLCTLFFSVIMSKIWQNQI